MCPKTGKPGSALRKNGQTLIDDDEEDEEDEENMISFLLTRFAARKNDPTYQPDRQEREKVQKLLYEGYSAAQIATAIDQAFDARPDDAKPVRGFGFIVSYAHRRLSPIGVHYRDAHRDAHRGDTSHRSACRSIHRGTHRGQPSVRVGPR